MADNSSPETRNATMGTGAAANTSEPDSASASLEQLRAFLKAKDDTSRFVGLAILKSVLDTQPALRDDPNQVISLWEAISPKFLDQLLRSNQNQKVPKDEAQNMVDIAVGVLHTFSILLPEEARNDKRFSGRVESLVDCLTQSSSHTTIAILQTILTLVSQVGGAQDLLKVEDLSPLVEISPQQPLVLDIISTAWSNASLEIQDLGEISRSIDRLIPSLIATFKGTDAVTFLAFIADVFPKILLEAVPRNPSWLEGVVHFLRKLVTSRPTTAARSAYTEAAAALLQVFPTISPKLLFGEKQVSGTDSKPFSYLFVNLLLIDIRSSFPNLLSQLNSADYPAISKRLSAAFDVVSSFIGYLVRSLDDDEQEEEVHLPSSFTSMPPDLLLRLRKDIAETMSLTIEYLRDRWDASVAGAPGLHPSARTGSAATSEGNRLMLTWDSLKDNISSDSLVLASIRTLAIWLREDENENLRNESAGLTDMLIELYKSSPDTILDFRYPILTAFEAIMTTEDGVEWFTGQDGWEVLATDLSGIVRDTIGMGACQANDLHILKHVQESRRGIEIIRVMLVVVDHTSTTEPQEKWMELAKLAASMKRPVNHTVEVLMEFEIAMLQLASALLDKAPRGVQKKYISCTTAVLGLANQLMIDVTQYQEPIQQEFRESLEDIVLALDNLR